MASAASKKLLKELPSEDDMRATLYGLLAESDQAVALLGAAYLDHALQVLFTAKFRLLLSDERQRLFNGAASGILGFMSAKIIMASALEMIGPDTYHDLTLINDIRNVFAHSLHGVSFETPLIARDCAKLKIFKPGVLTALQQTPKQKYFFTVVSLYSGLRTQLLQFQLAAALSPSSPPGADAPSPDKSKLRSRRNRHREAGSKTRQRPRRS